MLHWPVSKWEIQIFLNCKKLTHLWDPNHQNILNLQIFFNKILSIFFLTLDQKVGQIFLSNSIFSQQQIKVHKTKQKIHLFSKNAVVEIRIQLLLEKNCELFKGQMISKFLFDGIASTKKPTIFFLMNFCPSL